MSVKKAIQDVLLWRGLNFLSAFMLNVMVARLFEAEQAGSLFFVVNNLSLVILLLSFSLESGIGYYTSAGKIDPAKAGALALLWSFSATIPVALYFFIGNSSPLLGVDLSIPAICFVAGSLLISFYSALYYATGNFIVPNACSLAVNLILSLLFIAGLFSAISIHWLLYGYFIGFLVQGLAIAMLYFNKVKTSKFQLPASGDFKLIIRYSLIALLGNVIFFLVYRVDYWFVKENATQSGLGNYIQVSKIVQWFLLLPMAISSAIFPLTASAKDDDMMRKVVFLSRLLFWLFFFASIVLAMTGRWFFFLVFWGI
jgi:O-antigen/teichoic acid export membrane protein